MVISTEDLIAAHKSEQPALRRIGGVLGSNNRSQGSSPQNANFVLKLVSPYGDEVELPPFLSQALGKIVYHLALDQIVTINAINKVLSPLEAAEILNISGFDLLDLLDQGKIPTIQAGTSQYVLFSDLLKYKKLQEEHDDYEHQKRIEAIAEIARISRKREHTTKERKLM